MITKKIIAPLLLVIILAGIGGVLTAKKTAENRLAETTEATTTNTEAVPQTDQPESRPQEKTGRYETYSTQLASEDGFNNTVLFFHAGWCPECRAFKKAIGSEAIPSGTQVLEVDYDSSSDLKKIHGVTLQSTFVKIDSSGKQVSKWVGYGKNKSLQTVLNNL